MVKPNYEIFYRGANVWGVILKAPRKFKRLNHLTKRFSEDAVMREGEEALFWVRGDQFDQAALILARDKGLAGHLFRVEPSEMLSAAREAGATH